MSRVVASTLSRLSVVETLLPVVETLLPALRVTVLPHRLGVGDVARDAVATLR
jgi:hypothetical protein